MTVSRWHFHPWGRDKAAAEKPRGDRATGQSATCSSLTLTQQIQQPSGHLENPLRSRLPSLAQRGYKPAQTVADAN